MHVKVYVAYKGGIGILKKLISSILIVSLAMSFLACGKSPKKEVDKGTVSTTSKTEDKDSKSDKKIDFFGSDKPVVKDYINQYPELKINFNEKLPRDEILKIQNSAEYLIIALGNSAFEKGVLTGKFYEYVRAKKPIIALCDEDGELAYLINKYSLGIATRDHNKIADFILNNKSNIDEVPIELTSNFQFDQLIKLINEI